MRALLGLDSDIDDDHDEDQSDVEGKNGGDDDDSDASSSSSDGGFGRGSRGTFGDLNDGGEDDGDGEKQVVYIPGKKSMEEKIRQKLKGDDTNKEKEQTPWQKYLEKKKEKRRERRRAARGKSKEQDGNTARGRRTDASRRDQRTQGKDQADDDNDDDRNDGQQNKPSSKAELELLLAGDNGEFKGRKESGFGACVYLPFLAGQPCFCSRMFFVSCIGNNGSITHSPLRILINLYSWKNRRGS